MQPVPWPEPDPQVAAAIKAMYGSRKTGRPLAVEVRDRLGQWLADEDFAAAFGIRGRPGWPPSRLALVTVLQRAEKLTDRLAAEAVRARLDWKYLLGLLLDDRAGFQNSATGLDLGFNAARSYSLTRPPRTSWRLIRFWERSATGWSGRGG
jgi:Transposase domain (DUF772)